MSAKRCCPQCGFPIASDRMIRELPEVQKSIYDTVSKAGSAGAPLGAIIEQVYAGDPHGGPLYAEDSVRVAKFNLNKKLAPMGLAIRASLGRGARYFLRTLP